MSSDRIIREGQLKPIGQMLVLAPNLEWSGSISSNNPELQLNAKQYEEYIRLLSQSIVVTSKGGQRGCMDGRPYGFYIGLGPNTAGGTQSDADRVLIASYAYDPRNPISPRDAKESVRKTEKRLGFISGGHDFDQCGALNLFPSSLPIITGKPNQVSDGVKTFLGAVGSEYYQALQDKVIDGFNFISDKYGLILPSKDEAKAELIANNSNSCPKLVGSHLELDLVVFPDVYSTVDNDLLVQLTAGSPIIGGERQAFSYSWGMHLEIAKDLGGELGKLYLQTVPTIDIPTLTQLTDGTVGILAFEPKM